MNVSVDLDICMGKKYIFDYEYLDEMKNVINGQDYRLYFVMLSDKIKMVSYYGIKSILFVECVNESNNEVYEIELDMIGTFRVNNIEYLNIKLDNQGSRLCVSYTDKGVDYLKKHYPDEYRTYCMYVGEYGEFTIKIHVKNLMDMFFSVNNEEIVVKHRILYIGQSKQQNIFDRIENHSTIQKIHRDIGKRIAGKKIEIMLCDGQCKIIDRTTLEKYNSEIVMSNTLRNSFELFNAIQRNEAIDISEAMLIAHFKPEYNKNLKEAHYGLKTYQKFKNVEILSSHFSLDLFWDETKEKSILYTESMETKTKARVITCEFADDNVSFKYRDLEDKYY